MSLFPLSKLRRFASKVGALRDTASGHMARKNRTAQKTMDRIRRHLVIDPLEERQLLSVTPSIVPSSPFDNLVNETFSAYNIASPYNPNVDPEYLAYNMDQTTSGAQSIAVDDDGDFVIVWSRNDPVTDDNGNLLDKFGNPVQNEHTIPITDQNIYARYFTDEVQRITLPEATLNDDLDQPGKFSITVGGNETQKLTISESAMPYLVKNYGSRLTGDFDLGFDADGDGSLSSTETVTIKDFDEFDMLGNAALMQEQLQGMGGILGDIEVTALSPQEYIFQFGEDSGGLNQPLIQIMHSYTDYDATALDYLPGMVFETINEPVTIDNITIVPGNAELTAQYMETRFEITQEYYLNSEANSQNQAHPDYNMFTDPEKNYFVNWGIEVRPVSGSETQFDVTFTGIVSKTDVPDMTFASITDEFGNEYAGSSEASIVTIKEPSPEFQVNNLEIQNELTPYLDYTDQTAPAVAMDADGDFVITWQSEVIDGENSTDTMDILARRFTPTAWTASPEFVIEREGELPQNVYGVLPLGDQFTVNTTTTDRQDQPAIGMDNDGNFVISWADTAQDLDWFNCVMLQRYNRDGERIGGEFKVTDPEYGDDRDTDVHIDPYISISDDGHILVTWTETGDDSYINHNGTIMGHGWAKLFTPNMDIVDSWSLNYAAWQTSSAFDTGNNFLISGSSLGDTDGVFGGTDMGSYVSQYSINSDNSGTQTTREWFRANSSDYTPVSPGGTPAWPGHQVHSQVMVDADGSIVVTYEGYAPDVTEDLILTASDFDDVINAEQNPDLQTYLGTGNNVVIQRVNGSGTSDGTGDLEAEIERFLLEAANDVNNPATWEQLGRLRAAINEKVSFYRGDANGIMYTRLPAEYNSDDTVLDSDVVVNTERDGVNERYIITISKSVTGGDFTIDLARESYNNYYNPDGSYWYNTSTEPITIQPVIVNNIIEPNATCAEIEAKLRAALITGTARSGASVEVRRVDESYDWELRENAIFDGEAPWAYDRYYPDVDETDYVYEVTFQGSAHDTWFWFQNSTLSNDLSPDGIPDPNIYEYMRAENGTVQTQPSSGMTPDGSFVVAWTQYEEYSNGADSNTNIYFREYKSTFDTAGPRVTDFLLPDGERLQDGDQIKTSLQNIVVTFDEALATSGPGSVLDPDNWSLMKYDDNGDLTEVLGGITEVNFGMNVASDLSTELGLNPLGTNKWEAVLTLDANGTEAGTVPLENGSYVIVAKNALKDPSANPLGHTGYAVNGFDMQTSFTISIPSGDETLVNNEVVGVQETLPETSDDIGDEEFPNSPQSIAGDADGEHVVVWTDNGSAPSTAAGVYAKIYPWTWTADSDDERVSHDDMPMQIQVTDDPTAIYASVARDGDGDFVVTWSAQETDGDWNIWYRTFDAAGNATSDAEIVNSELDGYQQFSTVAMDNDGDFVITWQSQAQDGSQYGIFAQRFTPNATGGYSKLGGLNEVQAIELKGDIDVATFSLNFDYGDTDITCGEVSYYANVGEDPLQTLIDDLQTQIDLLDGIEAEVFKFNETTLAIRYIGVSSCTDQPPILFASKSIVGDISASLKLSTLRNGETSEFLVNETTQNNQMWPSVAMDYAGEIIVTWTSYGQSVDTPYESNIYARKFAANEVVIEEIEQLEQTDLGAGTTDTTDISSGMPLGDEFLVNKPYETQVLVVPEDTNEDPYYVTQYDYTPVDGNQKWSSVAMDADGDFVITWTGYGQDGSGNGYGPGYDGENGVFARRFDKDAGESDTSSSVLTYEVFQVNTFVESQQQHSSVAMDTDGDFVITWESFQEKPVNGQGSDAPETYGIYAQRYVSNDKLGSNDAYGVHGEDGGEFHVNTYEPGNQLFPAVTIDDTGDVVIVWNGTTTVDTDGGILLQRFEKTADDTGPRVTEVEFVATLEDGSTTVERITNNSYTDKDIIQLVVTFGEDLNIDYLEHGANSILNLDNWELSRLMSSGATSPIEGAIIDITFGRDQAYTLGLADTATDKYQAVISLDYDPEEAAIQPLPQGEYVLVISEEVQDLFGNGIQPNMQNIASDYEFKFAVKENDSEDTPLIPTDPDPGSTVNITDGRTYPESPGAVAVDGNGDYVAVWTAYDIDLGADRVFMMRFSTEGVPLWDEPQAITPTGFGADSQRYVTVACDPDGDFVVTWTNYRDEDGADTNGQEQIDIYAKRYAANGEAQGEAFRVNTFTASDQIWSDVAMDANGAFIVTWTSLGQENNGAPGYGYGIYARRYDEYGYALDTEFQVNTTTGGDQQFPSIAMAGDGTFVIAWQSDQNGVGNDIVSRTFNADGSAKISPLGGEYVVNDVRIGDQTYPDVAIDLAGETFVVTWTSTQATDDPSGSAVYTKAFDIISNNETNLHYEYTGDAVDVDHGNTISVPINISEGFLIEDLNITLTIHHNDPSDLKVWLEGPDGTQVQLFQKLSYDDDATGVSSGGNGANIINTTLDDAAETSIDDDDVLPPYTGTYAPENPLAIFNNTNAYGTWNLIITDEDPEDDPDKYTYTNEVRYLNEDGGTLTDWSMDFVRLPDISQETLVNTTTTGNQLYSSVDMDYQGNFIVTWTGYGDQEDQEDTSDYGVFTQQFALPASKVGGENRINQMTIGRQWISSVGMDAQGSYVTIWSGIGSTSDTSSNVFVRKENATSGNEDDDDAKVVDISGPLVGGIYDAGSKLFEGEVLGGTLDQLVVTFNEDINSDLETSGSMEIAPTNSVLNTDNWVIRVNGSEIIGGVTNVDYGFNPTSGKYEATVYFDGNGLTPGDDGLTAGQYELIIRDNIEDLEGNQLDGNYDGITGTDTSVTGLNGYRFTFNLSDSDDRFGPEVRANENVEFVQLISDANGTGQARETSVRSTAIDSNGDYVVVWTSVGQDDESDANGKGVYFQLYNADGTEKGTPVRVNNIITGNQQNASVAMDAAGDFVIVWESEQANGTYDIYAQRFNADGSRVANDRVDRIDDDPLRGSSGLNALNAAEDLTTRGLSDEDIEVLVNTTTTYNQINPEVTMDSFGNYAITWASARSAYGYFNDVNVQLFDYDGEPISEEFRMNDLYTAGSVSPASTAGFSTNPSIAMDDVGRLIVVWDQVTAQSNGVVTDTEVRGVVMELGENFVYVTMDNFLDTTGTAGVSVAPLSSTNVSGDSTADLSRTARNPQIALDSDGNAVLVYEAYADVDNESSNQMSYGIFYQTYDISASAEDDDDNNNNSSNDDDDEEENEEESASYNTIVLTGSGQANLHLSFDPEDGISDSELAALALLGDQVNPSVAMDANGGFAITWNGPGAQPDPLYPTDPELMTNLDSDGTWIRRFDAAGNPITTQQRVNMTEAGTQQFASVAMNREGDAVVSWSGAGIGDRHGIFSRQYNSEADAVGPLATELYHKGENPNVGSGDSYLFVAEGDQIYANPTSLLVVFDEAMNTTEKANNTPGIHSVENVSNWALINGKNEEVSGAIDSVDFYFDETLNKWVAEVNFTGNHLENGTYTLFALTNIQDVAGNELGMTGYRPNGTGMNLGDDDDSLQPLANPEGGFGFQFGINNTLPGDPNWGDIDQQVNEEEYGREDESVIARNASGDYVVAWVEYVPVEYMEERIYVGGTTTGDDDDDNNNTSSNNDDDEDDTTLTHHDRYFIYQAKIVAQRFDFWGREVGEPINVNTFELETSKVDTPIDIAIDDAGNFVVAWSASNELIEGEDGIFIQRFDYDGDKMGGQIRVNEFRDDIQSDPSIAMAGATGDFVVTWTSFAQDGNQDAIVARRYNLAGTPQGNEFIVNSHTYGAQRDSDVAMDAAGNFVVTWMGEKYDGGAGWEIYARRFNASGTARGNEFRVNTYTNNDQKTPAVAMDSQGNFVVTWASYVQGGNNLWDIYARRYNSSGTAQGNNFQVNQTTTYSQITPDVAMSTDNFVITWASFDQDYPYDEYVRDYGIYARMYNANGTDYVDERVSTSPVGEFQVNAVALGNQTDPAVSMDANGHYVVVWTGPNRPGTVPEMNWINANDEDNGNTNDNTNDNTNGDDDDGFIVDGQTYLEQDSTSIYSRLIDPPIVVAASTEPEDVSIMGTSGNDVIEFIGGPSAASWVIKVNGVVRNIGNNIGTLTLDGLGGNDTLLFTGSSEDDAIVLAPGSSSFISNAYSIVANHFESITANGGTGDNVVTIQDTSANDTLTIQPGLAELTGGTTTFRAENCATIHATSTSGKDTVNIYDTTGDDVFTATPTEASMSAEDSDYNVEVKGFRYVKSYSTGGTDTAELYDSAGDDLLVTHPAYAKLTGSGFYTIASDFRYISAIATEGDDIARMYDSEGDDNFVASADYAKFTTDSYYVRADNFDYVEADGSAGGNNTATLWGTDGDDTFFAGNGSGNLTGNNFDIQASSFQTIIGRGQGGNDTATLLDSSSDDNLFISSSYTQMQGTVYEIEAHSFESIKALSTNGGADNVSMYDSSSQDLLLAEDRDGESWVKLSSDELDYTYELLSFDQVTATSTTQGDKKDAEELDFLFAKGLWEDID